MPPRAARPVPIASTSSAECTCGVSGSGTIPHRNHSPAKAHPQEKTPTRKKVLRKSAGHQKTSTRHIGMRTGIMYSGLQPPPLNGSIRVSAPKPRRQPPRPVVNSGYTPVGVAIVITPGPAPLGGRGGSVLVLRNRNRRESPRRRRLDGVLVLSCVDICVSGTANGQAAQGRWASVLGGALGIARRKSKFRWGAGLLALQCQAEQAERPRRALPYFLDLQAPL